MSEPCQYLKNCRSYQIPAIKTSNKIKLKKDLSVIAEADKRPIKVSLDLQIAFLVYDLAPFIIYKLKTIYKCENIK